MSSSYRRLQRQNGIIAGVCGGLGAYLRINPWWFRILFLVLLLPGGLPGSLIYLIMWIVIPKKSSST